MNDTHSHTSPPSHASQPTPQPALALDAPPSRVVLHGFDFDTGDDRTYEFTGVLLGAGSSRSPEHVRLVHDPGQFAAPGERCSACRWFEVRIYGVHEPKSPPDPSTDALTNESLSPASGPAGYYVETIGVTTVPGEVDRHRVRRVFQPRRLLATLVQEKGGRTFVPAPSRHALDQAADRDPRIADVIDNLLVFD